MAEIRASTAKMWEEHSSGEDLVGLIQSDDHGHNILVEPANAEAGHVYGASLVRIDESTILKLRVPLDDGFVAVEEDRTTTATLPQRIHPPHELLLQRPRPPLGRHQVRQQYRLILLLAGRPAYSRRIGSSSPSATRCFWSTGCIEG